MNPVNFTKAGFQDPHDFRTPQQKQKDQIREIKEFCDSCKAIKDKLSDSADKFESSGKDMNAHVTATNLALGPVPYLALKNSDVAHSVAQTIVDSSNEMSQDFLDVAKNGVTEKGQLGHVAGPILALGPLPYLAVKNNDVAYSLAQKAVNHSNKMSQDVLDVTA